MRVQTTQAVNRVYCQQPLEKTLHWKLKELTVIISPGILGQLDKVKDWIIFRLLKALYDQYIN